MADPNFPAINVPGKGQLYARLETNQGTMVLALEETRAPKTVANFAGLASGAMTWTDPQTQQRMNTPMYDGVRFHRVVPDFVIQAGDPLSRHSEHKQRWGTGGPGYRFGDEINPELKHTSAGILSMANGGPNTNGSQFFITEKPMPHLDGRHSVFGHVVSGVSVIKKIASVARNERDCPVEDQVLIRVELFRSETVPTDAFMRLEIRPETSHRQVLEPRRMWVVLLYGWLALLAVQRAIYHHAYLHYDPFAHATFSDGQVYEDAARDILAHAPLGSKPFFLQGAYAYFLAAGLSVRGVLSDVLFLQLCLAAFACYCVHYAARRVFDKYDALLSTAMFLAYAGLPFYENKYLSAQLGVTANACVLACFAYLWHARNHTSALLFGLASGLSILARANLVLALPFGLYALWQLAAGRGTQRQLQLCAAAALGLTLALVPMATRNLVVTGSSSVLPSHAGGIPFYIGNHAGASGLWNDAGGLISGQVSEERVELATRLGLDPHARNIDQHIGTTLYRRAFAEIERDPLGWLRLEGRKLWLSVGNAELTHDYDALGERELLGDLRPLAIPFGVVLGFGAFGLYAAWRTPSQRLFALMLTGQLLAVLAANLCWFTSAQNRLPLIVPLALATAAFSRWLRRASRTRAVPQSWLVAAVGCMALGAQAYLARPESKRPSSAHYYNLANVEESLGLFEPALKHYQRACERNPKQPMFWLRLAHLARTMQRHAQAHDALDHLAAVPHLPELFAEAIRDERSALMQASSEH